MSSRAGLCAAIVLAALAASCQRQSAPSTSPVTQPSVQSAAPAAQAPRTVAFGNSFEDAFTRAGREGRRVLVYFTGAHCGWCRLMEQRTHADPQVVDAASKFVAVTAKMEERPDLFERYRVYGIPRTIVMTADGSPVDEFVGYHAPGDHWPWLKAALSKEVTTWPKLYARLEREESTGVQSSASPPPSACGAAEQDADLVIWFVDQNRERFQEPHWSDHADLLKHLHAKGFRARIEHLYRWDVSDRWKQAQASHRLPDLFACPQVNGFFQDLMKRGLVGDVLSMRLSEAGPLAVCGDFRSRRIFTVPDSPHAARAAEAAWAIFEPRAGVDLAPPARLDAARREAALSLATKAAVAWQAGDVETLRPLWDAGSLQRNVSDTNEEIHDRKDYRVRSTGARLYGNDQLAIALVETRAEGAFSHPPHFTSKTQRIGSPSLVILRRTASDWRVLAAGILGYDINVANVSDLLRFADNSDGQQSRSESAPAQLLTPADNPTLQTKGVSIQWRLPIVGSKAPQYWLAQTVNEQLWPSVLLEPISASAPEGRKEQAVPGDWTAQIWTIPANGRVRLSEPRHWTNRPAAKP
jgi:thioredoxin-like negative regulator of GroEL